jgi:DNA-binding transcriptional ArsR family regulator
MSTRYGPGVATTVPIELARLGSLLADETRAAALCALMDGRAHTGSELARHVGVAPSTMSEHLAKLLDAGVVVVEPQGRHRYWRLSDPDIAQLLESLGAGTRPPGPVRVPADLSFARTCYDHLAGELAVAIFDHLRQATHLVVDDDGNLTVSDSGRELFDSIGAHVDQAGTTRRPMAGACLDWSERRHHLAGAVGAALLNAMIDNGWIERGPKPRSVRITRSGRTEIGAVVGHAGDVTAAVP